MTSRNSTTDPGQPCTRSKGSASGSAERAWIMWIRCPSTVVVDCSWALSRASCARQSNPSIQ